MRVQWWGKGLGEGVHCQDIKIIIIQININNEMNIK